VRQEEGIAGRLVGGMIRRSVRKSFHSVYARLPHTPLQGPVVWACNHTGWHDGYLMFHLVTRLGIPSLDWVAEFDAFPLFRKIGAMPFPPGDPHRRVATIRETIRRMRAESCSLVQFADGILRPEGDAWEVGEALDLVLKKVPNVTVVPVAIVYRMGVHERSVAAIWTGEPMTPGAHLRGRTHTAVEILAREAHLFLRRPEQSHLLVRGTPDVNERWDFRAKFGKVGR
jgi:1-acyl-sn-glycerol-3-phosphate acyltransferase